MAAKIVIILSLGLRDNGAAAECGQALGKTMGTIVANATIFSGFYQKALKLFETAIFRALLRTHNTVFEFLRAKKEGHRGQVPPVQYCS